MLLLFYFFHFYIISHQSKRDKSSQLSSIIFRARQIRPRFAIINNREQSISDWSHFFFLLAHNMMRVFSLPLSFVLYLKWNANKKKKIKLRSNYYFKCARREKKTVMIASENINLLGALCVEYRCGEIAFSRCFVFEWMDLEEYKYTPAQLQ